MAGTPGLNPRSDHQLSVGLVYRKTYTDTHNNVIVIALNATSVKEHDTCEDSIVAVK